MRSLTLLGVALILAACGAPTATVQSTPAPTFVPAVGELLAQPVAGPIRTIGLLLTTPEGAVLIASLDPTARLPAPDTSRAIWLGTALTLDATPARSTSEQLGSLLVEASGRLEGPGAFGPDGVYRYRIGEPQIEPLTALDLTIPRLLDDPARYDGQPVRLRGELLTGPDSALLVERLGTGGVPAPDALQIKLAAPVQSPTLAVALKRTPDGRITFGPVEIVGLWRAGRLYPLIVAPR